MRKKKKSKAAWEKIGEVSVDTAEIIIADPDRILVKEESQPPNFKESGLEYRPLTYENMRDQITKERWVEVRAPFVARVGKDEPRRSHAGFVISTTDDGTYPVYVLKKRGYIEAVMVVFGGSKELEEILPSS